MLAFTELHKGRHRYIDVYQNRHNNSLLCTLQKKHSMIASQGSDSGIMKREYFEGRERRTSHILDFPLKKGPLLKLSTVMGIYGFKSLCNSDTILSKP